METNTLAQIVKGVVDAAWYAALAALVIVPIVAGPLAWTDGSPTIESPVGLQFSEGMSEIPREDSSGSAAIVDADGAIEYEARSIGEWFMMSQEGLIWLLGALVILYFLRKVVGSIAAGQPLNPQNARRLIVIGLAVMGLETTLALYERMQANYLAGEFGAEAIDVTEMLSINIPAVIGGSIIIALALLFTRTELADTPRSAIESDRTH